LRRAKMPSAVKKSCILLAARRNGYPHPVLRISRKEGGRGTSCSAAAQKPMTGTVKFFSGRRGYGFIAGDDGNDIYVHFSGIDGQGFRTLHAGERVSYEPTEAERGPRAEHVTPLPEEESSAPAEKA